MTGLILKDLYMTAAYCKSLALIVAVFVGVSLFSDNNLFFIMYLAIISSMVPVTLISYEERSRWTIYGDTLPYSRAQMVSAKYLLALLTAFCMILLSIAVQVIRAASRGGATGEGYSFLMSMLFATSLIGPSLTLPFIFKFGAEKGRFVYLIVVVVLCVFSMAFLSAEPGLPDGLSAGRRAPVVFCLAGLLLFALSWRISIRIYRRREL